MDKRSGWCIVVIPSAESTNISPLSSKTNGGGGNGSSKSEFRLAAGTGGSWIERQIDREIEDNKVEKGGKHRKKRKKEN